MCCLASTNPARPPPLQIELRLAPVLKRVSRALKAAERAGDSLLPGVPQSDSDGAGPSDGDADEEEVSDEDEDEEGDDAEDDGEEEEEDEEDEFAMMNAGRAKPPPRLPTEDAFFRLSDMERCVRVARTAAAAGAVRL